MTALTNPRYERFAREVAKGTAIGAAYVLAGYRAHPANPTRLRTRREVNERIREILTEQTEIQERALQQAIDETSVTKSVVLRMLIEDRLLARQKGQAAAAIRAAELLGKQLGMFIERREQGGPGDFAHLSDAELDEELMTRLTARGLTAEQARRFLITAPKQRIRDADTVQ